MDHSTVNPSCFAIPGVSICSWGGEIRMTVFKDWLPYRREVVGVPVGVRVPPSAPSQ